MTRAVIVTNLGVEEVSNDEFRRALGLRTRAELDAAHDAKIEWYVERILSGCDFSEYGNPQVTEAKRRIALREGDAGAVGDPLKHLEPVAEPFHRFVKVMPSGCWEWTGFRDRFGYGRVSWNGRQGTLAHRAAFSVANGPIPEGVMVCHTCDNPACCNPAHLWIGSNQDNQRDSSTKGRQRGQDQTHCKHGHEFTPENTYRHPGSVAARSCRACIRASCGRRRMKKAASQ